MQKVTVGLLDPRRFASVLPEERFREFQAGIEQARVLLEGRRVWNINSTAAGGGVAEMLRSLLAYARGMGLDIRWSVIEGNEDFFRVTKRIHNQLHGFGGDGGELGQTERRIFEDVTALNAKALRDMIGPRDVVIIHDPQPAGLVEAVKDLADVVIWRCHVGLDEPNELAHQAWRFLTPYVEPADAYVFSRRAFVWDALDASKLEIIPPSIDAFSPKNQELSEQSIAGILRSSGIVPDAPHGRAAYTRVDGSSAKVEREVTYLDGGLPPPWNAPIVTQVSRWDRLKDPVGVIAGFGKYVAPHTDAHLVVAGPATEAVADDPEGLEVIQEARKAFGDCLPNARSRIHLLSLPMEDSEENAAMVNALQRRSDIIVQKSLAEGFGLTVTEGMWKARPVVASRIGGIQDQIQDGETGVLLDDATDLEAYGSSIVALLRDPYQAEEMGRAAQRYVRDHFLGSRHLLQYLDLIGGLVS